MASCIRLFEKTLTSEKQEVAAKKQQASAELTRILDSLKQVTTQQHDSDCEEMNVPKGDDAALKAYEDA